jgi:hypothetical protein
MINIHSVFSIVIDFLKYLTNTMNENKIALKDKQLDINMNFYCTFCIMDQQLILDSVI